MNNTTRVWDWLSSLPADEDGWRAIPGRLSDVDRRFNLRRTSTASSIHSWVKAGKVEIRKAGSGGKTSPVAAIRFLNGSRPSPVKEELPHPITELPASASSKDQVLAYLKDHMSERGFFNVSNDKARRALHLSLHDYNKLLFDLREAGLISFTVIGSGTKMRLKNIRVRPAALVKVEEPKPEEEWGPATEPLGPIMQRVISEAVEDAVPSEKWPLIAQLIVHAESVQKAQQAIGILREAGMSEEADLVQSSVRNLTPLEEEVIRFVKEVGIHGS